MSIFDLAGTEQQNGLVRQALDVCTFPFDRLADSLRAEGRTAVRVEWADLSRRFEAFADATDIGLRTALNDDHSHVHDGDAVAHPIERVIDGRRRVLGLFYLPPHTRIVLDTTLEQHPTLAQEVFLAEAAHLVDYHYMNEQHRLSIVNLLHDDDLPPSHPVGDGVAFQLDGHTCSWFDVGPYAMWVGEAMMESFIEAFSSLSVTIALGHPTSPEVATQVRRLLVPEADKAPDEIEEALAEALIAFLARKRVPRYLRVAAERWLASG